jgi:acyl carrier protein
MLYPATSETRRTEARSKEAVMEDVVGAIHHIILSEFLANEQPEELTTETPLITGGILDSISTLKLVTALESQFGITIEVHEAGLEHLDSIARIAGLVALKTLAA